MLQRGRAFALGGKIDDHLRLLAVEKFHQEIELVIYVVGVIAVPRITVTDPQCEALVFREITTHRDDFGGIGMVEQIFRGMQPERSAPTEYSISLLHPRS